MVIDLATAGEQLLIRLSGRFDFTTRGHFLNQVEAALADAQGDEIRVDLGQVDYIDSSGLGMLLMLRDKAKRYAKGVVLSGAQGMVKDVIVTAQFDKLFAIR
jgi:anti-anti-sigma factor